MNAVPEDVKKLIRAVIISSPKARIDIKNFCREYSSYVCAPFQYKNMGFGNIIDALQSIDDVVFLEKSSKAEGGYFVSAVTSKTLVLPSFLKRKTKISVDNHRESFQNNVYYSNTKLNGNFIINSKDENVYIGNLPHDLDEKKLKMLLRNYSYDSLRFVRERNKNSAYIKVSKKTEKNRILKEFSYEESGPPALVDYVPDFDGPPPLENEMCSQSLSSRGKKLNANLKNRNKGFINPCNQSNPKEMKYGNKDSKRRKFHSNDESDLRHFLSHKRQVDNDYRPSVYSSKASGGSSNAQINSNLIEVCVANFPYGFSKGDIKYLVAGFNPMRVIMVNNQRLPKPDDITSAYVYFLDTEDAIDCVTAVDQYIIEDNVLYAFLSEDE